MLSNENTKHKNQIKIEQRVLKKLPVFKRIVGEKSRFIIMNLFCKVKRILKLLLC